MDGKIDIVDYVKDGIILVLSDKTKCQKCQIFDIDTFNKFYDSTKINRNQKVLGLYHGTSRVEALKYISILKPKFPFYYGENSDLTDFIGEELYPIVFRIEEEKVTDIHLTILSKKELSVGFWAKITNDLYFSIFKKKNF